ncbi:MAG: 1,2-phenylacetyl-CoA epoxidase subunit PaaD [Gammaproteobacteria bacterium]
MTMDGNDELAELRRIVRGVSDPEIPILSIEDLGVLRDILLNEGQVEVVITPTYVGCPAMDTIAADIKSALSENGYTNVVVKTVLSPAWTTAWLTKQGREKLLSIGIAPPNQASQSKRALMSQDKPAMCPKCHSTETECVSEFGSTACKALYRCTACLEPFDYFKCI